MNATGLWSLLDMLKLNALAFIKLGREVEGFSMNFYIIDTQTAPDNTLREEETKELANHLLKLYRHCGALGLLVSGELIQNAQKNLPQTHREYEQLVAAIYAELKSKLFLFVPSHRAAFYNASPNITGFPVASSELSRAGNCYAIGEPTACVFHAMRATEIGLRAVATAIGVAIPTEAEQWNVIIDQIESKVKALGQQTRSQTRIDDQTFYSEAAAQFRYLKDAWRNHVSHARVTHDENQALVVLEHSTELMRSLSSRLSE